MDSMTGAQSAEPSETREQEAEQGTGSWGPENPFYRESALPFHAPPFDRIRDTDYQPAFEAGRAEQRTEIDAIANGPAAATVLNTIVPLERSGQLYSRALAAFFAVASANTNPVLESIRSEEAPRMAAHSDAIYLNSKLFRRIEALYRQIESQQTDSRQSASLPSKPEDRRVVEIYYQRFLHSGANLSAEDKEKLKKLNEEESALCNTFRARVLAATQSGAFFTTDPAILAGISETEITAAAKAANDRSMSGYLIPLQNTTQQPVLALLSDRSTRQAIFENSWNRTARGDANDTREIVRRLVQLRSEKANLLGFASYAAWKLDDQMAKSPYTAMRFLDALVPAAAAHAVSEAADIQAMIDSHTKDSGHARFQLEPWDWEFYAEQVRKAKYDLDENEIKPYFEAHNVLENGVFYAATQLYGITFRERHDLPVYHSDVRVFEVFDSDASPLALLYSDPFKRDNKQGGAWMSSFVDQSKLLNQLPVVVNVSNIPWAAPGEPALISFDQVRTMFHEFGHALHAIFSNAVYPLLAGTDVPRDFVEFPSQFNEHWATDPGILRHYAKHCKTGAPMPAQLAEKIRKADRFNQGYLLTELLAAAQLDLQWHTMIEPDSVTSVEDFEKEALAHKHVALHTVPPRYRSSYFQHIFAGGYSASYYPYLWSEMLDAAAFEWFEDHGGLTRANGDRFRQMVLAKGNTEDPKKVYTAWFGGEPSSAPMLKQRGLVDESSSS